MLNAQIGAKKSWNGQYMVNCSKVPDLPELSFFFNGNAFPLRGSDYVLEVQGTCISSFTPMDLPEGLWIIGMLSMEYINLTMTNYDCRGCFPSSLLYSL